MALVEARQIVLGINSNSGCGGIRQRHIKALTMLFFQFQTHRRLWLVPKVTGQAPHKLAPCPLWKHWPLPGECETMGELSLRHMRSQVSACVLFACPGFETS